MSHIPFPNPVTRSPQVELEPETEGCEWTRYAAGGALVAAGLLLLTGQRRTGLLVGAVGAGLAILDQQEAVRELWGRIPGYLDQAKGAIESVQSVVEDLVAKGEAVRRVLA